MPEMPREVSDYFSKFDYGRKNTLETIRTRIFDILPDVIESIESGFPTYTVGGKSFSIASQKQYVGLYMCDVNIAEKYGEHLSHLNIGKSCIRFKKPEQLPFDTLELILKEEMKCNTAAR